MSKENFKEAIDIETDVLQVTPATIARTIAFAIVWLNQLFVFVGAPTLDIDTDALYGIISAIATFIVSACTYWKNNSWRIPALVGDAAKGAYENEAE